MDLQHFTDNDRVISQTQELYTKAEDLDIVQHYGKRRTEEACLVISARQKQDLLNNHEDLEHYKLRSSNTALKNISKKLDEKLDYYRPEAFLNQYLETNDIPKNQAGKAKEVLQDTKDCHELVGKSPAGLAAAALYIAGVLTDNYEPCSKVQEKTSTTEPTLLKAYKIMVDHLGIEEEFQEKHPHRSRTRMKAEQ